LIPLCFNSQAAAISREGAEVVAALFIAVGAHRLSQSLCSPFSGDDLSSLDRSTCVGIAHPPLKSEGSLHAQEDLAGLLPRGQQDVMEICRLIPLGGDPKPNSTRRQGSELKTAQLILKRLSGRTSAREQGRGGDGEGDHWIPLLVDHRAAEKPSSREAQLILSRLFDLKRGLSRLTVMSPKF